MSKFHISKSGKIVRCNANKRACPLGGSMSTYDPSRFEVYSQEQFPDEKRKRAHKMPKTEDDMIKKMDELNELLKKDDSDSLFSMLQECTVGLQSLHSKKVDDWMVDNYAKELHDSNVDKKYSPLGITPELQVAAFDKVIAETDSQIENKLNATGSRKEIFENERELLKLVEESQKLKITRENKYSNTDEARQINVAYNQAQSLIKEYSKELDEIKRNRDFQKSSMDTAAKRLSHYQSTIEQDKARLAEISVDGKAKRGFTKEFNKITEDLSTYEYLKDRHKKASIDYENANLQYELLEITINTLKKSKPYEHSKGNYDYAHKFEVSRENSDNKHVLEFHREKLTKQVDEANKIAESWKESKDGSYELHLAQAEDLQKRLDKVNDNLKNR